jgi:hypothetical protein
MTSREKSIYILIMIFVTLWIMLDDTSQHSIFWQRVFVSSFITLLILVESVKLFDGYLLYKLRSMRSFHYNGNMFYYGYSEAFLNNKELALEKPEIITGVAVLHAKSNIVFVAFQPLRHHDVIRAIDKQSNDGPLVRKDDQGFFTSHGRIINRKEALKVALNTNQVIAPAQLRGDLLYSEDVW